MGSPPYGDSEMTFPVVHINGTSKSELIELYENAYNAVQDAYKVLMRSAPNGRDYYPVPGSMDSAIREHNERLGKLDAVMSELEDIIGYLDRQ